MNQTSDVKIGKFYIYNIPSHRSADINIRLGAIIHYMEQNEIVNFDYTVMFAEENPPLN